MYSEKVLDHFQNPRNVGEIENPDGVGQAGTPKCGDIMKIYLRVENDIITDIKFKTFGCASAIASSSMATELVKGRSIDEAWDLTNSAVAEALDGLPPIKMHCSVLAEEAIHAAINDYRKRKGLPVIEEGVRSRSRPRDRGRLIAAQTLETSGGGAGGCLRPPTPPPRNVQDYRTPSNGPRQRTSPCENDGSGAQNLLVAEKPSNGPLQLIVYISSTYLSTVETNSLDPDTCLLFLAISNTPPRIKI